MQCIKAQAIFSGLKQWLFDSHRKNAYDNYVTGGNAKTYHNEADKANIALLKGLESWGFQVEEVHKEIEVNKSFDLIYSNSAF